MSTVHSILGIGVEAQNLTTLQVSCRAVVVFFATLFIVRIAHKRFVAKKTAFDVILCFILASMMARAINGSEQLVPTIVAGFLLAMLHRLLGLLSHRFPKTNGWIKGYSQVLIEDTRLQQEALRKHDIGEDDLHEALRLKGLKDYKQVQRATLERSGEISVIPKESGG
jgi:uncharacterized membrane protein YcaP (DUF421 family)